MCNPDEQTKQQELEVALRILIEELRADIARLEAKKRREELEALQPATRKRTGRA